MRDRMLHDSLRALTDDAARLLEDLLSSGAEIPFEVGETGGDVPGMRGSVTMFAYRPLTTEFVASHADRLRTLPTFENAAQNLARTRGVVAYLRVCNEPVLDVGELTHARLGVLAFLASVWRDAERFEHWGERFERAYSELESVALAERLVTTVFIPVNGVALNAESINLGAGVEMIALEDLDPACADRFSDSAAGADSYCSVSVTAPSDAPTPMPAVRMSARALLTALRLFRPGSVALGMTAQADIAGSWHQVSMPFSGRSHEDAWLLQADDEDELRQFVNAVRRVERRTRIAWALRRFETGLERTVPAEGLTDFLLALRALLAADDDRGKAALPARVSALCAQDSERAVVRQEIEAAFALERLAIDGHVGRADRKRLEKLPPLETIAAVERHLRALLHDLVCGYLSTDLKSLADEILAADGEPVGEDIAVEDPVYLEPVPSPGQQPPADPTQTVEFDAVFDDTAEIRAIDLRDDVATFHGPQGPDQVGAADNVWTLRPADEIAPAPEVEPEQPSQEVHDLAERLVERFDTVTGSMAPLPLPVEDAPLSGDELPLPTDEAPLPLPAAETPLPLPLPADEFNEPAAGPATTRSGAPAWDPSPQRRPVDSRDVRPAEGPSGFTFDFKPVPVPEPEQSAPSSRAAAPVRRAADPQRPGAGADNADQAFPIPEFGLPLGRGPAARRSDDEVDGSAQRANFREIMDENFRHPTRANGESVTTPASRDAHPHLVAVEGEPPAEPAIQRKSSDQPVAPPPPRILRPGQEPSLIPAHDPDLTVEYDVLGAEPSAEESAQLAWSQQFLQREEPSPGPETEPGPALEPEPAPIRPVPDLVLVEFEQAAERVDPQSHSSESARTHRIGPSTIEFRPLVDGDPDDPDDFSGAC